jgi:hypothetical protein
MDTVIQTPAIEHINIDAVADPTHPDHKFHVGRYIAFALFALAAYNQQNQPGAGPGIFLNPATLNPYLQGIFSLFPALSE